MGVSGAGGSLGSSRHFHRPVSYNGAAGMDTSKPYVAVATFCDRVLEEQDGVSTVVRVIDTVTVDAPPALPGRPVVRLPLFILLRSGGLRGRRTVSLRLKSPSNEIKPISDPITLLFAGEEHGTTIKVDFAMGVEEFGLYWVEVFLEDELLTRVPLRLRSKRESGVPSPSPSSRSSETDPHRERR